LRVLRVVGLLLAVAAVTVVAALAGAQAGPGAPQAPKAPGYPGKASDWAPGDKDGFGTSRTLRSKVWYTLNDGVLTEVFFPRIDTPRHP
jgi:glucoamylase